MQFTQLKNFMATTDKAIEVLKQTLESLENSLDGRTADIKKQYKEAIKVAEKQYKEALSIAEKTKDEALAAFKNDQAEIVNVKNALKSLTGETVKAAKASGDSTRISWNQVFEKALPKIGKPLKEVTQADVEKVIAELHPEIDIKANKNKIANALTNRKKKA